MASSLNVTLSGALLQVINAADSTVRVSSSLANPTLPASQSSYIDFLPIAAGGGTALSLPAATIWVLAIRNLGGINGTPAGNIQANFTVVGGAAVGAANSPLVLPNGIFIYWQPTEGAGGITAVTLIASIASTPVEILMAA